MLSSSPSTLAFMLSLAPSTLAFAPPRPNLLFVLADDLNADWKSDRLAYMPHLKKHFAEGGAEFVNHVAAVPVCGPSRSSLLRGRYPHNTGYLMNADDSKLGASEGTGIWLACRGPA